MPIFICARLHFISRRSPAQSALRTPLRDARFAGFAARFEDCPLDARRRSPVTRLGDKVALITGGGTGIGRACALMFARQGAQIALAGRRGEPLAEVVAEIARAGGRALGIPCDVTRGDQVERLVLRVVEHFGKLNVVLNNAGTVEPGTAEETSEDQFDRMVAVNLKGTFLVSRAALPELRRQGGGSIINLSSIYGLVGGARRAAYSAAKGGVTLMTRSMALDHAAENIRFNCICPALVETPLVEQILTQQPDPAAYRAMRIGQIPLGRIGRPEDVAHLAVYLASDESSWMTGAALPLDGGQTAY
jgi:meso-butanediol dehydrogenase/(S,S)-butanediol dehydrogenase/diacetyl reductase